MNVITIQFKKYFLDKTSEYCDQENISAKTGLSNKISKKNVNPFTSSQQMFEFFPSLSSDQNTNVVFVQNSCENKQS